MTEAEGYRLVRGWLKKWGIEHVRVDFSIYQGEMGAFVAQTWDDKRLGWRDVCAIDTKAVEGGEQAAWMATFCDECGVVIGGGQLFTAIAEMIDWLSMPGRKYIIGRVKVMWCEQCWPMQQCRRQLQPVVAMGRELARLAGMIEK